jgi:hypothetical protein
MNVVEFPLQSDDKDAVISILEAALTDARAAR